MPRAAGVGEASAMSTPMTASIAAPIMAFRSPMRATSHPAGRSPASSPTMSMAAMSPARASDAPRSVATTGMTGMSAPSPIENSSVGRNAGRMIERHENGGVASVIGFDATPGPRRGDRQRDGPALVPAQHSQGAEGVPAARLAVALLHLEVGPRAVGVLERPSSVVAPSLTHEVDGLARTAGRAVRRRHGSTRARAARRSATAAGTRTAARSS